MAADLPRPRSRAARLAAVAFVLAACVACDRGTKELAEATLPLGQRHSFLADTLRLEHVRNPGAFLGLGAALPEGARAAVFTWGVALVTLGALAAAVGAAVLPRGSTRTAVAAALVAAGGLGNLWDRFASGGLVTDFLNLGVGPLRTGIFNFADVALMVGLALVAWPERRRVSRRDA